MEEIQQRLSIHNEMVRESVVNHDVIFFGVEKIMLDNVFYLARWCYETGF